MSINVVDFISDAFTYAVALIENSSFCQTLEMVAALPCVASGRAIELGLKVCESVFCKLKRLYNKENEVIENNCM